MTSPAAPAPTPDASKLAASRERAATLRALALAAPAVAWIGLLVALPTAALLVVALARRGPLGEIEWTFSLDNFARLAGRGSLGWSADNLRVLARTLALSAATSAGAIVLAYPMAFWIARRGPRGRALALGLVVAPMCTNLVVRVHAWRVALAPESPLSRAAAWCRILEPGEGIAPGLVAVLLGMISTALPFAVLPLYAAVERLDPAPAEAARDLHASPARVFFRVVLPATRGGLGAAVILTFIPASGMFLVTDRLGGARHWILGNLIQQQFGPGRDLPYGAALGLALVAMTLAGLALARRGGGTR